MSSESEVKECLQRALDPSVLIVNDVSDGCGAKFEIVVVSEKFQGIKLLERHRMVQGSLGDVMGKIHALTIKSWTADQWESKKSQYN
ncbi:hypothetical protein BVRB_031250 [Beta vulgaris subsp. vulgaris]|uniref:BolA-like protein n=1 Tax=Beta vulgaris subsp. vulgaris TaxID=3555 RepID=A0A0J8AXI6_BETVV|nr:hypothetical protein BVRB_031250 [Beta vulgaris subsp. vulgaris]